MALGSVEAFVGPSCLPALGLPARPQQSTPAGHRAKVAPVFNTIEPVDPDSLPISPSGFNALDKQVQALGVGGIFLGLAAGTVAAHEGGAALTDALPWLDASRGPGAIFLGLIFMAAGVSHFTLHEDFAAMVSYSLHTSPGPNSYLTGSIAVILHLQYPGKGSWGIWYLPGSASFHVNWTGVAEVLGGLGLAMGQLGVGPPGLMQAAAAALFGLVVAVTPANTFMFSHGIRFPKDGPEVPVAGHVVRYIAQMLLLAQLWGYAI
ncbi:unnamed protein product [Chrysoparadoxa australica]